MHTSKGFYGLLIVVVFSLTLMAGCGGEGGGDSSTSDNNTGGSTYSISGKVADSSSIGISGVTVALTGASTVSTTTDSNGNYSITELPNGNYTVTPSKTGYTFNPSSTAVTVSGADVAGAGFYGSVIQTTTAIQGNLIVPSGDSAINYTVVNSYGSTTPDSSGNITTVQVSVSKPTATYAVSDTTKKVYAAMSTDTLGTLNLNAQTTAETLVLLNPFLITGNSEDYKKVISVVKSDPAVSSLASTIESVYASSADPLSDDRIKTALANAVKSVLTTLQNNGTLAKITPTTSKSLNNKTKTASLATGDSCGWASSVSANTLYICNYDMGALTTQNSSDSAIKLELNDVGPGGIRTNVTWVADIVELDASKIPDFINGNLAYSDHNLENYIKNNGFSERVIVPGELAGGALGVALSGDIFGVIGDAISSAVISDEGVVLPNSGIYAIMAYSGSYWGDDSEFDAVKASSWQKERWKDALQVNIASIALDALGLVLDLSNMPDEGNKALAVKAAEKVASLSLKIDQEIVNQGDISTTFLSFEIKEVFTALYEVAKIYTLTQISEPNASHLKTFFDTTLNTISDVYSGSAAVTNIGTRILNLIYNVTPRESAVAGYGNYWVSVSYFKINSDASSSTRRTVTLNNTATGSPTQYMASESSTFSGASWQTYSTTPSFTLSSGNAAKTVYFKVKNSAGESTISSDSITLNEASTTQYTLTVSKSGTGSGTVSANTGTITWSGSNGTASYNSGTSVTLTASASSGSTFAGWSGGGCSGTGTCTVTMSAATTVTATFNTSSNTLSITTTAFNPATATVGTGYAAQQAVTATGGQTPYSCSASGLPSGMAMNSSSCAVYGTPAVSGTFNVTVTVTDSSNPQKTASKVLTLTVSPAATAALSITTTAFNPSTATVGTGYAAQTAIAATGGQTPYSCSASGLPSGMAMNASTCAIYGTPAVSGTFNVTVTVTDSSNPQKTASTVLTLTVSPAATTTPTVTGISPTTFTSSSLPYSPVITVSGTNLDQITSVKYSWTGATSGTENGVWASTGTTSRTLNPTVLTSGDPSGISTWTVRFYNSAGSEIAGTSKTFTVTYSPVAATPTAPSGLVAMTASNFMSLAWNDNSSDETGFKVERKAGISGSWSQIASVGQNIAAYLDYGVSADITYYYRVYAYNASGSSGYSNEVSATISAQTVTPYITSVSPNPAVATGSAQSFTINGTGFVSGATVTLRTSGGGVYANRSISSQSETQIVINPNFGTISDTWTVEVINPGSVSSGQFTFTVQAQTQTVTPYITSVSPNPATATGSAQPFTITGSNFVSGATVTLRTSSGGVYANRSISSQSETQIVINPNFGTIADTWTVEVINPGSVSSGQFTFTVRL